MVLHESVSIEGRLVGLALFQVLPEHRGINIVPESQENGGIFLSSRI